MVIMLSYSILTFVSNHTFSNNLNVEEMITISLGFKTATFFIKK